MRYNLSWLNLKRVDNFDEKGFGDMKGPLSPLARMPRSEAGGGGVEVRGWRALSLFPTRGKAAKGRVMPLDF
jgi:hypothetical protein